MIISAIRVSLTPAITNSCQVEVPVLEDDLADLLAATADGPAVRATLGDRTREGACGKLLAQLAALNVPD